MATVTFDDFEDLFLWVAERAKKLRNDQSSAKTQKKKDELGTAAMELEYVSECMKNSNLAKGRFISVDDEIDDAVRDLTDAKILLLATAETVRHDAEVIDKKIADLLKVKNESDTEEANNG